MVRGAGTKQPIPNVRPLPQSQLPPPIQSYFGTIQSTANDMDDVSTLGDPFMVMGGDANARMIDADNTVGERYVNRYTQFCLFVKVGFRAECTSCSNLCVVHFFPL